MEPRIARVSLNGLAENFKISKCKNESKSVSVMVGCKTRVANGRKETLYGLFILA